MENVQAGECFGGKSDVSDYHRKASWSIDSTLSCSNRCDAIRFDSTDSLSSQSIMVNQFNVILIESIRCNSVRFNWLTIIAKHHGQSVQRHLDRIDTMQFGSIQLTHYHRKVSWSIGSTSSWSNRYDAIRFDSVDSLSSQSMVNPYDTIQIHSTDWPSYQSIASNRFHSQSIDCSW